MTGQRILIAGVGNIFCGDDAFGVEVAQRLTARALPDGVRVVDFGIRGFDLAYALMDDQGLTILVDAMQRGDAPGTLYVIEPDPDAPEQFDEPAIETHGMHPLKVLQMVRSLGGRPKRLLVVGCEPAMGNMGNAGGGEDDWQMGLSEPVEAALDEAVDLVETLVADFLVGHVAAAAGEDQHAV